MKLKFIDETEYNTYLEDQQNISIQMRCAMKNLSESTGWVCHYVGLEDDNQLVGTAILRGKMRKFAGMFYTCQYGPLLDYSNPDIVTAFFSQLPALLKTLNTSKFEFNPNLVWKQYTSTGELIEQNEYPNLELLKKFGYEHQDINENTNGKWNMRFHYAKSLVGLSKDDLIKSYGSQGKRSVKKAAQNGIIIEELAYDQTPKMQSMMEMSATKHGFNARNQSYYNEAYKQFGENVKFIVAKLNVEQYISEKSAELTENQDKIERFKGTKKEKQIPDLERKVDSLKSDLAIIESSNDIIDGEILMSAGMFLINGPEFIYLFGGNNATYQKFCSSFALQHYAMELAIDLGIDVYNMYGIDGNFNGTDSLLKFKSSFGGYVNEFIGTYEITLKPGKIKRADFIKKLIRR